MRVSPPSPVGSLALQLSLAVLYRRGVPLSPAVPQDQGVRRSLGLGPSAELLLAFAFPIWPSSSKHAGKQGLLLRSLAAFAYRAGSSLSVSMGQLPGDVPLCPACDWDVEEAPPSL